MKELWDGEWDRSYIGSIARSGACGSGWSVGVEIHINIELAEVGGVFGR